MTKKIHGGHYSQSPISNAHTEEHYSKNKIDFVIPAKGARLESILGNSTKNALERYAEASGTRLNISFEPLDHHAGLIVKVVTLSPVLLLSAS